MNRLWARSPRVEQDGQVAKSDRPVLVEVIKYIALTPGAEQTCEIIESHAAASVSVRATRWSLEFRGEAGERRRAHAAPACAPAGKRARGRIGDRDEIIDEAADLVYHLIVLLAEKDLSLADVGQRLAARRSMQRQTPPD